MEYSTTGIAYAAGTIAISLLAVRLLLYAKAERSATAIAMFLFTLFYAIIFLVTTIASVYFYTNAPALVLTVVLATFFQGLGSAFLGYLAIHSFAWNIAPVYGFLAVFLLTLFATGLAVALPFQPFFSEGANTIEWEIPLELALVRSFIFLVTFLPMSIVFIRQFMAGKDVFAKIRALILGSIMISAFVVGFAEFILESVFQFASAASDYALFILATLMTALFFVSVYFYRKESGNRALKKNSPA